MNKNKQGGAARSFSLLNIVHQNITILWLVVFPFIVQIITLVVELVLYCSNSFMTFL